MQISMKIINLDEFQAKLKQLDKATRGKVLLKAVEAGARVVEVNAKLNVERTFSKHATGGLAGSITVDSSGSDRMAEAKIGPTVEYGRIQELGGTIKPVSAQYLSWIDPDTGERMRAKSVTLPARPYLRPAMDDHGDEIEEAVAAQVRAGIAGAL